MVGEYDSVVERVKQYTDTLRELCEKFQAAGEYDLQFKLMSTEEKGLEQLEEAITNYFREATGTSDDESNQQLFNLGVELLCRGYPSIGLEGMFPIVPIISEILSERNFEVEFEHPVGLGIEKSDPITVAMIIDIAKRILQPNEDIEYACSAFSVINPVGKNKGPGVIVTNKRLVLVGFDDASRLRRSSSASVMVHPGVAVNIPMTAKTRSICLQYTDLFEHPYYGSIDYLDLSDFEKVKKKGRVKLQLPKSMRVLEFSGEHLYNRPALYERKDLLSGSKLIKPVFGREIELAFLMKPANNQKSPVEDLYDRLKASIK